MEGANWEFNAPTFIDFGRDEHRNDDDGVDDYFNYDHESANKTMEDSDIFVSSSPQPNSPQNGNHRQTFETPKHIRPVLTSDQGSSASPPFTVESEGIKLPVIASDDVFEKINEDYIQPSFKQGTLYETNKLRIPPDSLAETSCVEQKTALDSLHEIREEEPMPTDVESTFVKNDVEDGGVVLMETPLSMTEMSMEVEQESDVGTAKYNDNVSATSKPQLDGKKMAVPASLITPNRASPREQSKKLRSAVPQSSKHQQQQRRRSQRLEKMRERRRSEKKAVSSFLKTTSGPPPTKKKRSVQLSVPLTPTVLKHQPHTSATRAKSREELELEEIQQAKLAQQRRLNESRRSFKAAMHPPPPRAPSPAKRTKVKEFKFATDERMKSANSMQTRSVKLASEVDFAKGLRQHHPSPTYVGTTVPKPFKLTETKKRKLDFEATKEQGYAFKPMAKAVMDFQRTRSVSTRRGQEIASKGPLRAMRSLLTVAKTPKLESKSRKRPIKAVGTKEREEQEVEEMKQYQFKAKPANRKILEKPEALPKVERQRTTDVQEFHLNIDKRIEERPKHEKTPLPTWEFKARPVPDAVIKGPVHPIKTEPAKFTVPKSPAFQLRSRMEVSAHVRKEMEERAKENMKPKAKPDVAVVTKPKKQEAAPAEKKAVEVKPFSFHVRDVKRFANKEKKIQEIHEAERAAASAFRATPMLFDPDCVTALPSKQVRPTTKAEPFHLASDERGATRSGLWKADLERESQALKEMTAFRANTDYVKVLQGDGFKPIVTKKYTDKFDEFPLHTNVRASKRQEFDERQKQVEAAAVLAAEENKRIAEELADEQQKKARKLAEHKAAPIRKYKRLEITASIQELTNPQSPNFSDRFYKKLPSE